MTIVTKAYYAWRNDNGPSNPYWEAVDKEVRRLMDREGYLPYVVNVHACTDCGSTWAAYRGLEPKHGCGPTNAVPE